MTDLYTQGWNDALEAAARAADHVIQQYAVGSYLLDLKKPVTHICEHSGYECGGER